MSVDCIVQAETFLRDSVVSGEVEMVRMLINAKGNINNVSGCVDVFMLLVVRVFFSRGDPFYFHVR